MCFYVSTLNSQKKKAFLKETSEKMTRLTIISYLLFITGVQSICTNMCAEGNNSFGVLCSYACMDTWATMRSLKLNLDLAEDKMRDQTAEIDQLSRTIDHTTSLLSNTETNTKYEEMFLFMDTEINKCEQDRTDLESRFSHNIEMSNQCMTMLDTATVQFARARYLLLASAVVFILLDFVK